MMSSKAMRRLCLIGLVLAALGAVSYFVVRPKGNNVTPAVGVVPPKRKVSLPAEKRVSVQPVMPKKAKSGSGSPKSDLPVAVTPAAKEKDVVRTEAQRKATEMRELLDSGNEKEALYRVRELIDSDDVDVRSQVVTVAGWLGVKALPELTELLGDEDESVAERALAQWQQAFDEIEDPEAKAKLLVAAISTMKNSEEMESLAMAFSQLPEGLSVKSLADIMDGKNQTAVEVARQQAGFIMGAETSPSSEEARNWAQAKAREDQSGEDPSATPNVEKLPAQ